MSEIAALESPAEIDALESSAEPVRRRRYLWIELSVVTAFAYVMSVFPEFRPNLIQSQKAALAGYTPGVFLSIDLALPYLRTAIPILFIVWLADHSLSGIGFVKPRWKPDLVVGGALVLFVILDAASFRLIPRDVLREMDAQRAMSSVELLLYRGGSFWMIVPAVFCGVFLEEVLFRGYLLSRLQELFGNWWAPSFVSSLLFGIWHWYQGPLGMIYAFGFGLAAATCFAITKRIWPALLVHLAYDSVLLYMAYLYLNRHR